MDTTTTGGGKRRTVVVDNANSNNTSGQLAMLTTPRREFESISGVPTIESQIFEQSTEQAIQSIKTAMTVRFISKSIIIVNDYNIFFFFFF